MCYYSDVKQFSGVLRETIRPDREWEDNIGETAKRAEKYADKLISDLLLEIDRINKIKLPVPKNGLAPEGQMHIDLYLGREGRVAKSERIWREKWLEILPIITDIRDDIKAVKKDMRSVSENRLVFRTPKDPEKYGEHVEKNESGNNPLHVGRAAGIDRTAAGWWR